MTTPTTPWHRQSFDHFLQRRLPALLDDRLGLTCAAERTGPRTCRVVVRPAPPHSGNEVAFDALPAPDDEGVFEITGDTVAYPVPAPPLRPLDIPGAPGVVPPRAEAQRDAGPSEVVVLPRASTEDLAAARIDCVGDQLHAFIDARLSRLPVEIEVDADLIRTLLPLDTWMRAFLAQTAQHLQNTNGFDRAAHLRRLLVMDRREAFTPGHFGRTCPFETPEGPNIARVLSISRGADIRDGRLISAGEDPVARLGLTAACIPFLEHDDGNRILMGANMMRQWLPPAEAEAALVQTGYEADVPGPWCGRNLLTAFVSWDGGAFEDALVISATAARKLACPLPLEPGDKLSNRHGIKGVVSRVLADDEMPRLPDGTPVELIFSICGVPSRWTVGQLREAALSHAARRAGTPALVPPFGAPDDEELRRRVTAAGLPADGMLQLTDGDTSLHRRSTAGWVYWGCTLHLAREKLHFATHPAQRPQRLGRMEVQALAEAGAHTVIADLSNTASAEHADADTLADRVAAGAVQPDDRPSPRFAAVAEKLARGGVRAAAGPGGVTFSLEAGAAPALELVEPVPHPWLPGQELRSLATPARAEALAPVVDADDRLRRLLADSSPAALLDEARRALASAVADLHAGCLSPEDLTCGTWVLFSGRSILVPGPELDIDQLGLPVDMAWGLFGSRVAADLGDTDAVDRRTPAAAEALARIMAASWIIFNRAPSVGPTSLIAFRPRSVPGKAIRLHPLVCRLLDADFDGDQGAVFLPLTAAAQREAGERLTVAGHLGRHPDLIDELVPAMDARFGLACLSRTPAGRQQLAGVTADAELGDGICDGAAVGRILRRTLERDGIDAALAATNQLMTLGFAAARAEGGSIGPFIGHSLALPPAPATEDADVWQVWQEEVYALIAGFRDYDDEDLGVVCLLSHSGARANTQQVAALFAAGGPVHDLSGALRAVRRSWREGLTPAEADLRVVGARRGLFRLHVEMAALGDEHDLRSRPDGFGVLARARRCRRPDLVFARAAARGEVDPLADDYARLFVGIAGAGRPGEG